MRKLENHFIVVGLGRLGREVAEELHHRGHPVVAIEVEADPSDRLPFLDLQFQGRRQLRRSPHGGGDRPRPRDRGGHRVRRDQHLRDAVRPSDESADSYHHPGRRRGVGPEGVSGGRQRGDQSVRHQRRAHGPGVDSSSRGAACSTGRWAGRTTSSRSKTCRSAPSSTTTDGWASWTSPTGIAC